MTVERKIEQNKYFQCETVKCNIMDKPERKKTIHAIKTTGDFYF